MSLMLKTSTFRSCIVKGTKGALYLKILSNIKITMQDEHDYPTVRNNFHKEESIPVVSCVPMKIQENVQCIRIVLSVKEIRNQKFHVGISMIMW